VHGLRQAHQRLEKSFWTHLIKHLGNVGHVESHFGLFKDSVSIVLR
jgi:hypothetical protein